MQEFNLASSEKQDAIKTSVDSKASQTSLDAVKADTANIRSQFPLKLPKPKVKEFTTAGSFTWTVPSGVTEIVVSAVAGGGGGADNIAGGVSNGGPTSLGKYFFLEGGAYGEYNRPGLGGGKPVLSEGVLTGGTSGVNGGKPLYRTGPGGDGSNNHRRNLYSGGGSSLGFGKRDDTEWQGYGGGGAGRDYSGSSHGGGGGGEGLVDARLRVTPGETLDVVVGHGGEGRASMSSRRGRQGCVLISWY